MKKSKVLSDKVSKLIVKVLQFHVLDPNNYETRKKVIGQINPALKLLKEKKNWHKFKVVCDRTNNNKKVRDANELRLMIIVQTGKDTPWTLCEFIATRSYGEFKEVMREVAA